MQRVGPMMGDTPSGVVAWRMWPSRVDRLQVVDPRTRQTPPVQSDTTVIITSVQGGAREPQSGFPDGVGVGWVGRRLVLKVFSHVGFSSVLRSRSSTRTGWFSRLWTSL